VLPGKGLMMSEKSRSAGAVKLTYEEGLEELTRLVDEIGRDDCPVDQLEVKVRKAADLLKELRRRLASTEVTVREVLDDLEETKPGV
jgi:exodeoxyribonuclease VII small subunit